MIYILRQTLLLSMVGFSFLLGSSAFAIIANNEPAEPIVLTIVGCDIPVDSSTCTAPSALLENPNFTKSYSLYNATTQVSSSNAFNQKNEYEYVPLSKSGTALELRFGTNLLRVNSSGGGATEAVQNVSCSAGSVWNGSVCIGNAVSPVVNLSGSITLDSASCVIPSGSSECGTKIAWSVLNPVEGKTEFIVSGGYGYTMNQNSYAQTFFYNKAGENTATYTLKNNGHVLDVKTVTSKCITGSSWNGSVCKNNATVPAPNALSGYITIDSATCNIPLRGSYCGTKVSYVVNNPVAGKTQFTASSFGGYDLYSNVYSPNMLMNNAGENTTTYRLQNNGVVLDTKTVTSHCISGSAWNGSICSPVSEESTPHPVESTSTVATSTYSDPVVPVVLVKRGNETTPSCSAGYVVSGTQCKIVSTGASAPGNFDASKYLLKIDQRSILVRGFIQSVNGNALTIRTIGGVWNVTITPSTAYVSADSRRPLFNVGDYIGAQGGISTLQDYTFSPSLLRNRTLYP